MAFASAAAAAADFTWTGAAPGDTNWSNPVNWSGGIAPSGTVGTLTFPRLPTPGCPGGTKYGTPICVSTTTNDVSGLNVGAISIDDSAAYAIYGGSFTLGAGGITANRSPGSFSYPSTVVSGVTLSAPQTWSVDDSGDIYVGLRFAASEIGGDYPLTIALSSHGKLDLAQSATFQGSRANVGAVTITGANPSDSGPLASLNGIVSLDNSALNADNGNPVRLIDAAIVGNGSTGPLTSSGGQVDVSGTPGANAFVHQTLAVKGAVTLDSASEVDMDPVSAPLRESSQLSATGTVNLANAGLRLVGETPGGFACSTLTTGHVDTLVTTTGPLLGTFANLPDGTIVPGCAANLRINYSAHAVTATVVVAAPTNLSPATISGTPVQGQTLTEAHGSWTDNPTSFSYQWEDCSPPYFVCSPIAGATAQSYLLTAADVGHTIRVVESATNDLGTGARESAPTAVVQGLPHPSPPPELSELRISPSVFAAARRDPKIARLSIGSRISYSDSQAALTTFTVRRGTPGVLHGGRCVKAPAHPHPHGARRCTRFVRVVGSFTHADAKGQNHVRFTGRLSGRALKPGSYQLSAVATGAPGVVGIAVGRRFRIMARANQ